MKTVNILLSIFFISFLSACPSSDTGTLTFSKESLFKSQVAYTSPGVSGVTLNDTGALFSLLGPVITAGQWIFFSFVDYRHAVNTEQLIAKQEEELAHKGLLIDALAQILDKFDNNLRYLEASGILYVLYNLKNPLFNEEFARLATQKTSPQSWTEFYSRIRAQNIRPTLAHKEESYAKGWWKTRSNDILLTSGLGLGLTTLSLMAGSLNVLAPKNSLNTGSFIGDIGSWGSILGQFMWVQSVYLARNNNKNSKQQAALNIYTQITQGHEAFVGLFALIVGKMDNNMDQERALDALRDISIQGYKKRDLELLVELALRLNPSNDSSRDSSEQSNEPVVYIY